PRTPEVTSVRSLPSYHDIQATAAPHVGTGRCPLLRYRNRTRAFVAIMRYPVRVVRPIGTLLPDPLVSPIYRIQAQAAPANRWALTPRPRRGQCRVCTTPSPAP